MLENGQMMTINIRDILPNRFQPRIHFEEEKLSELAESIRKYGLIQPVVVRQIGSKYEIISGERRFKASFLANKETIPAIVVNLTDRECEEIALLENIQRQDLTPIEEAVSFKRILDVGYVTQEQLAAKVGKSQSFIANKIRLLNLDDDVQDALLHGQISERHARSLLKIHDKNKQVEMLNRIIDERLTVKMTDKAIKEFLESEGESENVITDVSPEEKLDSSEVEEENEEIQSEDTEQEDDSVIDEPEENQKENIPIKENVETLVVEKKPRRAIPVGSHEIIKVSPPRDLEEILKSKERGASFMDIDKILEEAKDIEPQEETKAADDVADLMKQDPNTVTSPLISNETVPNQEESEASPDDQMMNQGLPSLAPQNRFVSVAPAPMEAEAPMSPQAPAVSFDSVFGQTPNGMNNQFNSMNSGNMMPGMAPGMPSMDYSGNSFNNPGMPMNNTSFVNQGQPIPLNNDFNQMNQSMNFMPMAQEVNQPMMNTPENVDTSMSSSFVTDTNQAGMQETSVPLMPTTGPISLDNFVSTLNANANMMPQEEAPSVNFPEQNLVPNINGMNNQQANMGNQGISPLSIPDADIIETPNTPMDNSMAMPPMEGEKDFKQVLDLVRNCSSQIEKLGYYIDVDEADMGDSYQFTIRVNKK